MEVRAHLLACVLVAGYLTPSSGQLFENPRLFFHKMEEDFDLRVRGSFKTPHCVKLMMNCWEIMSSGHVCSELSMYFASPCTAMRTHRCLDFNRWGQTGWPYNWMQLLDEVCPPYKTWTGAGDS